MRTIGDTAIEPVHRARCHCGIYTHHRKRSDPSVYGFNLGCLDGVNPFDLKLDELPVNDGVNHPSDRK